MSLPTPEMYRELRMMAKRIMQGERKGHTLSATDLFHEAYSRLRPFFDGSTKEVVECRSLFAMTMRRVLVDHARKRMRRSRCLSRTRITDTQLEKMIADSSENDYADRLVELDLALHQFAKQYPVHSKVVELKYFGGLTVLQCAEQLDIGAATVQRYWNFARAWIGREMEKNELSC